MTKRVNSESSAMPSQPSPLGEQNILGRTEKLHQVNIQFDDDSKEKATNLFESTKDSISSFFSNLTSHLNASVRPLDNKKEGILSKIAKIIARFFSLITQRKSINR